MSDVLWVFVSLVAYIGGLVVIAKTTPRLLRYSFDEGSFMGFAVANILGAILAFGGIVALLFVFNAALAIKILAVFLLLALLLISGRQAMSSFRPRRISGTFRSSRILVGSYCLLLAAGAVYLIIELFLPT